MGVADGRGGGGGWFVKDGYGMECVKKCVKMSL